ncbi:hypothetical protein KPN4_63 [Klebsiella phage KPN4]|uniref:Uncharacterized protein n=1 Tax=Klebsiella phage KPN4 TaxID=2601622 RepID=A0A5B9NC62_9CAUD|nr:hypothetical protein KPN4_63 [Klebsiella phage KPN4]
MAKQTPKKAVETKVATFPKTEANRKARLERHLRKHPADTQAASAVGKPAPRRKKPVTKGSTSGYVSKIVGWSTPDKADTKEVLRKTQGRFGSVKPNIFGCEYSRENVRALCYGVGIKFTGKANKPRNQKRKPAKKA